MPKHQRSTATDNWQQLELLFTSPEQRAYELIRPVVLFGVPPKERAQQTGTAERTLYRNVQRFVEHGMASLFATPPAPRALRLPSAIREAIVALKVEHPPVVATCFIRHHCISMSRLSERHHDRYVISGQEVA